MCENWAWNQALQNLIRNKNFNIFGVSSTFWQSFGFAAFLFDGYGCVHPTYYHFLWHGGGHLFSGVMCASCVPMSFLKISCIHCLPTCWGHFHSDSSNKTRHSFAFPRTAALAIDLHSHSLNKFLFVCILVLLSCAGSDIIIQFCKAIDFADWNRNVIFYRLLWRRCILRWPAFHRCGVFWEMHYQQHIKINTLSIQT